MKNLKDLKTKKPWRRVRPEGYMMGGSPSPDYGCEKESLVLNQNDFLKELYPSGHKINSEYFYPDIFRYEEVPVLDSEGNPTGNTKREYYRELMPRYSFAFQRIIATKQLVHLCGNDIQFEINKETPTTKEESSVNKFREGWLQKDMEEAFFGIAESVKCTGDGAIVYFFDEEKRICRNVLSFAKGDRLYPHYGRNGKLVTFARFYNDYDDEGNVVEWAEVWDDTNYYILKRSEGGIVNSVMHSIFEMFNFRGYTKVSVTPHGFPRVPVSYMRDDNGPCWSDSQSTIEAYEMTFSQMAHNNEMYGEPILVYQGGDNIENKNGIDGTIKSIAMDSDSKVSYLQAQSASESFMKQLDTLYKMIFTQSFIVEPPELKSGDLPAAALKILYSPAVEKAMMDANTYQDVLNDMVELFMFGYGVEIEDSIGMQSLPMKWWIKPYVHVSESAIMADLVAGVNSGFISRKTAAERSSFYSTTGEYNRVIREKKEEESADLLYKIKTSASNQ